MRVTLLGTGSADGWPNAFCACASCTAQRSAGRTRAPSSALVDGVVLVDPSPTAPQAASRLGVGLRGVEHVLVTHGHPDHLDPAFLLARTWAHPDHVLHVWAPPLALELCRPWLGADSRVALHAVAPGDELALRTAKGSYAVQAVAAAHAHGDGDGLAEEALLYAVTGPDGHRLLYATDTGLLPSGALAGMGAVDLLLVDVTFGDHADHGTGHLDLSTLPVMLNRLAEDGVVVDRTRVLATHLSHHNPPEPELARRLAAMGVGLPRDGDVVDTAARVTGGGTPRAGRHLVTGGARSGKSRHAERLAVSIGGPVTYVATGGRRPGDDEWAARVAAHRDRRPASWATVETTDLVGTLAGAPAGSVVLVDCLTLWLTATLDAHQAWRRCEEGDVAGVTQDALSATGDLVDALLACPAHVILVTNEVGDGVVPSSPSVRLFRDLMGRVNATVAAACDTATLVVAGRALSLEASR